MSSTSTPGDKASNGRRSWVTSLTRPKSSDGDAPRFRRSSSLQSVDGMFKENGAFIDSARQSSTSLTDPGLPIPNDTSNLTSTTSSSSDLSKHPSSQLPPPNPPPTFNRYSLTSMLTLGLVRDKSDEGDRGRSLSNKDSNNNQDSSDRSRSRGRSISPFRFRSRSRNRRDPSPSSIVEALSYDAESDSESAPRIRPRNAFSLGGDESSDDDSDASEESWSDGDELTAQHTEANAALASPTEITAEGDVAEPDPLGEGVNVIIPSEPYFPSTHFSSGTTGPRSNPRRRKSTKVQHDLLPMKTDRPQFSRNRCTIVLTHGNPSAATKESGRLSRTYIVASDLSEESRYAVEWGIGTVLRDGDELIIVNVNETESKLDPPEGGQVDRMAKLRSQQERSTLASLLVRQATGLLQRTKLHVTVICQAWHAKSARHLLLDLIDHRNPTMVIVGSRGLTRLKGILLGSTSHYLIQKSSVPVMVARRRLKRPARKSAHLSPHRARVSLAEAAIDKVGPGRVDKDVEVLRDELQRDDAAREAVDLRLAGTDRGLAEEHEENDIDNDAG